MSDKSPNTFTRIFEVVSSIPYGHVATYGQIAELVPISSARIIGFALSGMDESHKDVPWHRVVNRNGEISLRGVDQVSNQKQLLISEGIEFNMQGRIDLEVYGW